MAQMESAMTRIREDDADQYFGRLSRALRLAIRSRIQQSPKLEPRAAEVEQQCAIEAAGLEIVDGLRAMGERHSHYDLHLHHDAGEAEEVRMKHRLEGVRLVANGKAGLDFVRNRSPLEFQRQRLLVDTLEKSEAKHAMDFHRGSEH